MQILTLLIPFYIFLVIATWLNYGVVIFGCHLMRMAEAMRKEGCSVKLNQSRYCKTIKIRIHANMFLNN